jgi:methyl-accepting chemotaxis protein
MIRFDGLSLNKKLVSLFLLSGIIPALLVSVMAINRISKSLTSEARDKLIAIREAKAFQLEELYNTISGQVSSLARNQATVEAAASFTEAYSTYSANTQKDFEGSKKKLKSFYLSKFGAQYEKSNIGKKFEQLSETYGMLDETSILLQDSFISSNKNALGEKDALSSLNDGSTYDSVHSKFHDTFRTYLKKFDYYDIFIVDAKSGNIVYSVYKELDFATSLKNGPYKNSGIATAFKMAKSSKDKDDVYFTELDKYFPSYDAPAQFVSAPIYREGKLISVLIFQIPLQKIDAILTSKQSWKKQGQGDSGETYVIGSDKTMKSVSRFIVEDPKGFFAVMKDIGLDQASIDYMSSKKTSAVIAKVDTEGSKKVIAGKTGFDIFKDYRNVNVLSAFRPLEIKGLKWYILSEMDESEALGSLYDTQKIIYGLIAISALLITLFSFSVSKRISGTLVRLSEQLNNGAQAVLGTADSLNQDASDLSSSTQEQAANLQETASSISEISAMVAKSSENVTSTSRLSNNSQAKAEEGQDSVKKVKTKIDSIHKNNEDVARTIDGSNKELEEITDIIQLISDKANIINDIVFQTKLLSFNASVEAARAGEHGKGFSVVAEEIGSLAEMSGKAATEIGEILNKSIDQVNRTISNSKGKMDSIKESGKASIDEGIQEVANCDRMFSEILDSFKAVNQSIQEISFASAEQSSGVKEITDAVQQLDTVTQRNSTIAHQTSSKAGELRDLSSNLLAIVEEVNTLVFGVSSHKKDSSLRLISSDNDSEDDDRAA